MVGGEKITVTRYEWTVQLAFRIEVSRVQIPLMMAWALTIHKCPGAMLRDLVPLQKPRGNADCCVERLKGKKGSILLFSNFMHQSGTAQHSTTEASV